MERPFASESVTEGHPDKTGDEISGPILDAMLRDDPGSRVVVLTSSDYRAVRLTCAIGQSNPVGVFCSTFGTGTVPDQQIQDAIAELLILRPTGIIAELDLLRPANAHTGAYGYFGRRNPDFDWEHSGRADTLAAAV